MAKHISKFNVVEVKPTLYEFQDLALSKTKSHTIQAMAKELKASTTNAPSSATNQFASTTDTKSHMELQVVNLGGGRRGLMYKPSQSIVRPSDDKDEYQQAEEKRDIVQDLLESAKKKKGTFLVSGLLRNNKQQSPSK